MEDPLPENITGSKVQRATHSVEWQINVSHVLLFFGLAYLATRVLPALVGDDQEDHADRGDDVEADGAEIAVNGGGLAG